MTLAQEASPSLPVGQGRRPPAGWFRYSVYVMHKCRGWERYTCNLNLNCTSHRNFNVFAGLLQIFALYSLISYNTISLFILNYMSNSQINFSLGNHDFRHMIRIHLLNTAGECKGSRRKHSFRIPVSYLSQGLKSSSFLEIYPFWLAGAEARACMSCRQWQQPMECISLSVNKLSVIC